MRKTLARRTLTFRERDLEHVLDLSFFNDDLNAAESEA